MAATSKKYRLWCETESAYVFTPWFPVGAAAPDECTNDPGHTIDTDLTLVVDEQEPILTASSVVLHEDGSLVTDSNGTPLVLSPEVE